MPMNAFIVEARNQPGELARVAGALGDRGVNITTGAAIGMGAGGGFGFLTNDESGARSALQGAGIDFREVEVIPVNVADEPGQLAAIARKLGDAGVNIEFVIPTGMSGGKMNIALGVDNVDAARSAIGGAMATAMPGDVVMR
jgi:hypothetical protein